MNLLRFIHYKRNWHQRKETLIILDGALQRGFVKVVETNDNYHEMGRGDPDPKLNDKYTKRKGLGSCELVYDANDLLVTDSINMGTFNFFDPDRFPIAHIIFDVFPYILWGNSKTDPTTIYERLAQKSNKPIH